MVRCRIGQGRLAIYDVERRGGRALEKVTVSAAERKCIGAPEQKCIRAEYHKAPAGALWRLVG